MELNEKKKLEEFEKQKAQAKEKRKNKQLAHRKVVSRQISKNYLSSLRNNAFTKLRNVGFFTDQFKVKVLDNDVVPWLYDEAFRHFQELVIQQTVPTNLALDHLIA